MCCPWRPDPRGKPRRRARATGQQGRPRRGRYAGVDTPFGPGMATQDGDRCGGDAATRGGRRAAGRAGCRRGRNHHCGRPRRRRARQLGGRFRGARPGRGIDGGRRPDLRQCHRQRQCRRRRAGPVQHPPPLHREGQPLRRINGDHSRQWGCHRQHDHRRRPDQPGGVGRAERQQYVRRHDGDQHLGHVGQRRQHHLHRHPERDQRGRPRRPERQPEADLRLRQLPGLPVGCQRRRRLPVRQWDGDAGQRADQR